MNVGEAAQWMLAQPAHSNLLLLKKQAILEKNKLC
jgi:hypothetical protein